MIIINIASSRVGAPEILNGVYAGTKAFVLALSAWLHKEIADNRVRVQFWEAAGHPTEHLPDHIMMHAGHMIDAALAGLDQDEPVALPSPPDAADWQAYEAVRLMPNLRLGRHRPAVVKRSNRNNGGGK